MPSGYPSVVLEDKPLAYWRFGEASGAVARSEVNSPAMDAEVGGDPLRRMGAIVDDPNGAFEFKGQSDKYVSAGDRFDFRDRQPFSLETWLFLTRVDGGYRHLFVRDHDNNQQTRQEYGVYAQQNQGLAFERIVFGEKRQVSAPIGASEVVRPGTWQHVVATYDGSTLRLFVDGDMIDATDDDRMQDAKTDPFYVGRKGPGDGALYGAMDEVAIYDKALDPKRIAAHYNAGVKR